MNNKHLGQIMCGKVGIILVNYNGAEYIIDCINSLLIQTYDNIAILFWDNNSIDTSVKIVEEMFPQIHLIRSRKNYGFAKANNLAVRKMYHLEPEVEYMLLLNVDTIADRYLVESLLRKANFNTVTTAYICMGKYAQSIWYAGGELQLDIGNARHLCIRNCTESVPVTFVSGCCMMIHSNIIRRYGLFDTAYYMYYEDTDLCMRWYLQGVKMYYIPEAKLWHKVGGSLKGEKNPLREYYMVRNRLYFADKYARHIKMKQMQLLYAVLKDELDNMNRYGYRMMWACFMGVIDFIFAKMGQVKHII